MMLTSVSTSRMHSLSWHPPALSLQRLQRRGGFFEANVSGTGGKPHQGGLGGDCEKLGKGATGVALCYHKFKEYRNLSKEQQEELTKWNKENGGGKNHGKKKVAPATSQTMPRSSRA
jgi:hypothetical protein